MRNAERPAGGMSTIVQIVARWLRGPILVFGIYIIVHGHHAPGGGFAGGVVIACGFILLILAYGGGRGQGFLDQRVAAGLKSLGILAFLVVAWLGTWSAGGYFFDNFIATPEAARFTLLSGGTIQLSESAVGLLVASALFLVFLVLAGFRLDPGGDDGMGDGP